MRHMYPLFFLAWGAILILIAIVNLIKGKALPDVAAIGCMGLIGIALAVGVWTFLGKLQQERRCRTQRLWLPPVLDGGDRRRQEMDHPGSGTEENRG
jgi:hypothetical protein